MRNVLVIVGVVVLVLVVFVVALWLGAYLLGWTVRIVRRALGGSLLSRDEIKEGTLLELAEAERIGAWCDDHDLAEIVAHEEACLRNAPNWVSVEAFQKHLAALRAGKARKIAEEEAFNALTENDRRWLFWDRIYEDDLWLKGATPPKGSSPPEPEGPKSPAFFAYQALQRRK